MTIPTATYRLQLHPGYGFDDVAKLAPYLRSLGVSHVYLSPYLQAARGSTHGYDVVDHSEVNAELGGAPAHARMVAALRAAGLGQVVDVVPNHMATSTPDNRYWWDLLEQGRNSRYASYFDVDFQPVEARLHDKVLVPILADHYGRVLEAGEIRLERQAGRFRLVAHGSHVLPLSPQSVGDLLRGAAERCNSDDLAFVADALVHLAPTDESTAEVARRRQRDIQVAYRMIERLMVDPSIAVAVDAQVGQVNESLDELDQLVERQHYRIAYWRMARHDLDYRRFFDVDNLAALRMERSEVFYDTHATILSWVDAGIVDGLRIDHPDGLLDPQVYLERLRQRAPNAWIVTEKILARGESLPSAWPVDGTTGYDFLNVCMGVFIDPAGAGPLGDICAEFSGSPLPEFHDLARDKKEYALKNLLPSELKRLITVLVHICEEQPRFRDYSRDELRHATRRLIACLPVYRTYVSNGPADERDRAYINRAVAEAEHSDSTLDGRLLALIARILLGGLEGPHARDFRSRFQQLSAATMAKGVEDTAFYCYSRLLGLNEVGGEPGVFGVSVEEFHSHCMRVQASHPYTMLSSSTHDTKRSEDVRARLSLLSEWPDRWREVVQRMAASTERYRKSPLLDRETEYFVYQTLVAAWPIDETRMLQYMEKAVREAKVHTSWYRTNEEYETVLKDFLRSILADAELRKILDGFVAELRGPSERNALAQLVLKLTAPGVPDVYQGSEVFRYDLTDPDNRRPVDFETLAGKLEQVQNVSCAQLLSKNDGDLRKLFVTHKLLQLRREQPEWFGAEARYQPIASSGAQAQRVLAFARGANVVVAVPRLTASISDNWADTEIALPPGEWQNVLCGETVKEGKVAALFGELPCAVLVKRR